MLYLAGQIILFLILAALIGFVVGWLFRHFWGSGRQRNTVADINRELETCRSLLRTAQDRASSLERAERATAERAADFEASLESAAAGGNAARIELDSARARISELETAAAAATGLQSRIENEQERAQQLQARITELEADLAGARSREADLEARTGEIDALRAGLADRDAKIGELEATLATGVGDNATEEGLRTDLADREARIALLEAQLSGSGGAEEQIQELGAALDAKDARIAELEGRTGGDADDLLPISQEEAAAEVAARFAIAPETESDDLQLINGIGPKLERLLNSLGIRTFGQIASWGPDDVAMVTAALDAFPGRIERDDWIGGAQAQLEGDATAP